MPRPAQFRLDSGPGWTVPGVSGIGFRGKAAFRVRSSIGELTRDMVEPFAIRPDISLHRVARRACRLTLRLRTPLFAPSLTGCRCGWARLFAGLGRQPTDTSPDATYGTAQSFPRLPHPALDPLSGGGRFRRLAGNLWRLTHQITPPARFIAVLIQFDAAICNHYASVLLKQQTIPAPPS